MNEPTNASEWQADEGAASLTLADIDTAVLQLVRFEEDEKAAKDTAKAATQRADDQRDKILAMLNQGGKSKYFVEGIGTVYIINRLSFRTPKDVSSKEKFFGYIRDRHGEDVLKNLLTVNSQTLNGFCKKEIEAATARGEAFYNIPGIEDPTHDQSIGLKKG